MKPQKEIETLLKRAEQIAREHNHEYMYTEHVALAMLDEEKFTNMLQDFGTEVHEFKDDLKQHMVTKIPQVKKSPTPMVKTQSVERIFNRSLTQVLFNGRENITYYDIFVSMMSETKTFISYLCLKYNINKEEFVDYVKRYHYKKMLDQESADRYQEVLKEFTTNLNELAEAGKIDPVIGRTKELEDLCQVLGRRNKNNVLMVGDPGVGKTAIAEGLALRIINDEVPGYLKEHVVYNLEVGAILAGTTYRGQFEERVKDIIEALKAQNKAIVFIDEAHTMNGAGAGSSGGTDMSNMLKPHLAKGELKVVASTTWEEYTESFEKDRALMRRFLRLDISEPTPAVAKKILKGTVRYYEQFHNAKISTGAIEAAVDYSVRHQPDKRLPDKAFDLIDSACARQRMKDVANPHVDVAEVLAELSRLTNIPVDQFDDKKQDDDVLEWEDQIKSRLYGQDSAVEKVLEHVYMSKAGLGKANKPMGSFVFLGPTGVGKTELAKLLSEYLHMPLLRYDMSEYQERHTVARFIGAPPGYVGYEDSNLGGGLLIKDLQRNPYSVVLFDEIEKAHPDVTNVLLQMLDEGFVTSSNGKRADARNTIIIMTSNLGATEMEKNSIGFGSLEREGEDDRAMQEFFRPEFRNRINAICKFNKLDNLSQRKIVIKIVQELTDQLRAKGISLHIDEASVDYILERGYDAKMGARPLDRTIDRLLRIPISKKLLVDKNLEGCKIKVRIIDNKLALKFIQGNNDENDVSTVFAEA
jgi:ATP-dependent Clp protease ATP-binding subunit ClpA